MIYLIIKYILIIYFYWVLDISVHGLDNIPEKGPAIIVANHPGLLDGFLIMAVLKRRFHTFAKEKVFSSRLKMLFLRSVGGIPVGSEEINKNAFIEAQQLLKKNKLLLIFPESKINPEPYLLPFKSGFLRLAVECNVPVVPVVIMGSEKSQKAGQFFPRPSDIYVRFLEPQSFNISNEYPDRLLDKKELQYYIEEVKNKIQHKLNFLRETHAAS